MTYSQKELLGCLILDDTMNFLLHMQNPDWTALEFLQKHRQENFDIPTIQASLDIRAVVYRIEYRHLTGNIAPSEWPLLRLSQLRQTLQEMFKNAS